AARTAPSRVAPRRRATPRRRRSPRSGPWSGRCCGRPCDEVFLAAYDLPMLDPLERWKALGLPDKPDYAGFLTFPGLPYTQDPAELEGYDVAVVPAPTPPASGGWTSPWSPPRPTPSSPTVREPGSARARSAPRAARRGRISR